MKKLFSKALIVTALTTVCMFFAQSASAATVVFLFEEPRVPESLIITD